MWALNKHLFMSESKGCHSSFQLNPKGEAVECFTDGYIVYFAVDDKYHTINLLVQQWLSLNQTVCICVLILYQLSHKGSPRILQWVAYPFSSGSSRPRNWTRVSCIAGGFFTSWAIREVLMLNSSCKYYPFFFLIVKSL